MRSHQLQCHWSHGYCRGNEILLTQRNIVNKHLPKYLRPLLWWSTLEDVSRTTL